MPHYTGPDRRQHLRPPDATISDPVCQWQNDAIMHMDERLRQLAAEVAVLKESEDAKHAELAGLIARGFPDGDALAHRQWHSEVMEANAAWKARRKKLIDQVVQGVGIAVLLFITYAVWDAIKAKLIFAGAG